MARVRAGQLQQQGEACEPQERRGGLLLSLQLLLLLLLSSPLTGLLMLMPGCSCSSTLASMPNAVKTA